MNNKAVYCSLFLFSGDSRYTFRIAHAHMCPSIPLTSTSKFGCVYLEISQTIFTTHEKRGRENCEHCRPTGHKISPHNVKGLSEGKKRHQAPRQEGHCHRSEKILSQVSSELFFRIPYFNNNNSRYTFGIAHAHTCQSIPPTSRINVG